MCRGWGIMRGERGVLALVVVVFLLLIPAGALVADPGPVPTALLPLSLGMNDQMKTRNVLAGANDPHTTAVLARVYDTAIQRNATTGEIVPRVAVGEDANGNGALDANEIGVFDMSPPSTPTTVFYDFTNVRFHDGTPVTIMDVLVSYHLLALHPQLGGPLSVLMDRGRGPGSNFSTDRWLWVLPVDDGDGNTSTSALRFSRQFLYEDFAFATLGIPILPRHLWEGTGSGRHPVTGGCPDPDWGRTIYPEGDSRAGQGIPISEATYRPYNFVCAVSWQMTDPDVVGSGHFRFGAWVYGAFVRLDVNPDYAFGVPKVTSITFKLYRTTQLGVLALMSGDIDFLFNPMPPEFLPDLRNDPHIAVESGPGVYPYSMFFNTRRLPFGYDMYPPLDRTNDVGYPLRIAMQYIIDKGTIVRALLQDYGSIGEGMIAPTNNGWHNTSLPAYAYDTAQAAAVLDGAGWPKTGAGTCQADGTNCRSFPRLGTTQFEILTPQADYDPIMASSGALIAAAARSIGVNVVSKPTAFGAIMAAVGARDFDVVILGAIDVHPLDPWTLMRGDPDYLVDHFHSSNVAAGRNLAGYSDGPLDARLDSAQRSDGAARARVVKWAEGILAERLPAIPIYYREQFWAYRADRFTGWQLIASTLFNYWSLQDLDSRPNSAPTITLNSPPDGALIAPGVPIDLEVTDEDLLEVSVTLDSASSWGLPPPYDVDTAGWPDGVHTLRVTATDSAFNSKTTQYSFTVDGTPPAVVLVSPRNNSLLPAGSTLDFDVSDVHLMGALLRIDGGSSAVLPPPYDVPLTGVSDGAHSFSVGAIDEAGNLAIHSYAFTLDATRPEVVLWAPIGERSSPPEQIRVTFSEAVNKTSVEAAFSVSDGERVWRAADGTFLWSESGTSFSFVSDTPFAAGREYRVELDANLTDAAGNAIGADFAWTFTTRAAAVGLDATWIGAAAILAVILGLLLLVLVRRRRPRNGDDTTKPKP